LSKAIQKRVNSPWMLGGEIIRNLNERLHLRRVPVERLLSDLIDDGGPLLYHDYSKDQQRSFDCTCRKLRKFSPNRFADACRCRVKPEHQNHVHLLSFPQPS
jgi:hypothetical protein